MVLKLCMNSETECICEMEFSFISLHFSDSCSLRKCFLEHNNSINDFIKKIRFSSGKTGKRYGCDTSWSSLYCIISPGGENV